VQNYPSPIPNGSGFRYSESGYTRQSTGGCGFWNADADWANSSALPTINAAVTGAAYGAGITNRRTLDLSSAFNGQRLCESSVGLYEERSIADWRSSRRGRACVRQAYNGGTPRGGTCRISGTGLVGGEPRMSLS
jgi:hypothetical protein